jgi:hypothetical protein
VRVVVLLVFLTTTAHAMSDDTIEGELSYVTPRPAALSSAFSPELYRSRLATIERGLRQTTHLLARANLVLARADLFATAALENGVEEVDDSYFRVRALTDYRSLIDDPKLAAWKNLDAAMYRLAWMMRATDASSVTATELFAKLADRPSPYRSQALLALADYEYEHDRRSLARVHYDALLAQKDVEPELRTYALYKRGYTLLELGEESFSSFAEALTRSPPPLLAKQLRKGLVVSFARFSKPEDAYPTFHRLAPDAALDMLHEVIVQWMAVSREYDASVLANELLRRDPDNRLACTWAELSVRAMHKQRLDARIVDETEKLVRVFQRVRSLDIEPLLVDQCRFTTQNLTLDAAREFSKHLWDRETAYFVSARLYDLYLGAFPDDAIARRERANLRPQFSP